MKLICRIILILSVVLISFQIKVLAAVKDNNALNLTKDEINWLETNKNRVFTVGIDPYTGIEYFKYKDENKGYMEPLLKKISEDLGINFKLEASKNWGEVYAGLQNETIDILYGANETPERDKFMVFTKPVLRIPYAIIGKKDGNIHTIGDIDKKKIGFLQDDYVIDTLPKVYKHIQFEKKLYSTEYEEIAALRNGFVDAVVTAGGPVVYDYIYKYRDLSYTFKINSITSDMTFSARIADKTLIEILNKEISYLENRGLSSLINDAEINYNIKVMNLSDSEENWLKTDGTAVIGITKDYLPFDYFENGDYKGIDGEIIKEISRMTGIKLKYDYGDFDDLAEKLKLGKINVLNIAKTDDRLKDILYPDPFSTDRDIIVGRKDERDVRDIFGLEGKKVAVIKGFWHYEMLTKNLSDVKIIETNNIQESMKLVHDGQADYLIENPSVVRYYIEDLQYYDLVQRGNTNSDSFLYFGVSKNKPELANIINKVLPMMDIGEISIRGYDEVPHQDNRKSYERLIFTVIGLVIILLIIIVYVVKLVKDLIREKTEKELLKQREYLLSIDTLTELHNRNYFNTKILGTLDDLNYPQMLIVADMNNLKLINDTYGHQSGDILLKAFADILKEVCPPQSHIFRLGGDEFIIIRANADEEMAEKIIMDIQQNVKTKTIEFKENESYNPNVALGYSVRYSPEKSFEELFKDADLKMYKDKKNTKIKA